MDNTPRVSLAAVGRGLRALHRDSRGMISTEYMLILAVIVLPIGLLLLPMALEMLRIYGGRMISLVGLPIP